MVENEINKIIEENNFSTTDFRRKEALIIWQSDYTKLRKVPDLIPKEGQPEQMSNLAQAKVDGENARDIAKRLGITEENITVLTDVTTVSLNQELWKIHDRMIPGDEPEDQHRPTFLFVYVAGHGVAKQE